MHYHKTVINKDAEVSLMRACSSKNMGPHHDIFKTDFQFCNKLGSQIY